MLEDFLTVKEAQKAIRIGETKIYDLLNKGDLQAIKIGRKTLIPVSSVKAFLSSQPTYK